MVKLGKHVSSEVADAHLADGQTSQRHRRRPSNRCVVVFRRREVPAVPRVPSQRTGQVVRAQRVAHQTQVLEAGGERAQGVVVDVCELRLGEVEHVEWDDAQWMEVGGQQRVDPIATEIQLSQRRQLGK